MLFSSSKLLLSVFIFSLITAPMYCSEKDLKVSVCVNTQLQKVKICKFKESTSGQIWKAVKKDVQDLINIKSLTIVETNITTVPGEILSQLTNLKELDLHDNSIAELPEEIGLLTKLIRLDLSRNCLKALPDNIKKLGKLKYFYLSSNPFILIPSVIQDMTSVREFHMLNTSLLNSEENKVIISFLKKNRSGALFYSNNLGRHYIS